MSQKQGTAIATMLMGCLLLGCNGGDGDIAEDALWRAGGLGTVESVGGKLDGAEGVFLGAGLWHGGLS